MKQTDLSQKVEQLYKNSFTDNYRNLNVNGFDRLGFYDIVVNRETESQNIQDMNPNPEIRWMLWSKNTSKNPLDDLKPDEYSSLCAVLYEYKKGLPDVRKAMVMYESAEKISDEFLENFKQDLDTVTKQIIYSAKSDVVINKDYRHFSGIRKKHPVLKGFMTGLVITGIEAGLIYLDREYLNDELNNIFFNNLSSNLNHNRGLEIMTLYGLAGGIPLVSGLIAGIGEKLSNPRSGNPKHQKKQFDEFKKNYLETIDKSVISIFKDDNYFFGKDINKELDRRKPFDDALAKQTKEENDKIKEEKRKQNEDILVQEQIKKERAMTNLINKMADRDLKILNYNPKSGQITIEDNNLIDAKEGVDYFIEKEE